MIDYAILVDITFSKLNSIYISTAQHDIVFNGTKYNSVGDVIDISKNKTVRGIKSPTTKVTLAGEAQEYISAISDGLYINGYISVALVRIDDSGAVIDSQIIASGMMNKPKVSRKIGSIKTEIEIQPPFILFEKALGTFPVDSLQRMRSMGDTIFQYAHDARTIK